MDDIPTADTYKLGVIVRDKQAIDDEMKRLLQRGVKEPEDRYIIKTKKKLFVSGRTLESCINKLKMKKDANIGKRFVEFLDSDNFSAVARKGHWYFQHWHSQESITRTLNESGFKIVKMFYGKMGDSFQIEADKVKNLTQERMLSALKFEFDLPLPNGSYERQGDVISALREAGVIYGEAKEGNRPEAI